MNQDLKKLIEYPAQGILSREVFKNEIIDGSLFCLAAGTAISEHTSNRQGLIYVIEGQGIFNLAGEEIIMKPGIFIYMAENAIHSLRAEKDAAFLLILIKSK